MEILRVTVRWSGFSGAPGYSAFHFAGGGGLVSDAQQVANRVAAASQTMQSSLPVGVALQVQSEVERIDSDSGELLGFHQITQPQSWVGQGSGGYSAASGACVNWRTDDVRAGRRIRGRTFLVPLAGIAYDAAGTLSPAALTDLREFAEGIMGTDLDSEFGVWSRPVGGSGGVFATASGFSVPDKAAVLRSRRD